MTYSKQYFNTISKISRSSAEQIVPLVLKYTTPKNVIDVGCGTGEWLAEFKRNGIMDITGLDGSSTQEAEMVIAKEEFINVDLAQPFKVERRFDLAVSLEVAEHLPPECAEQFVECLTRLAPIILFSAAIPDQGGENHVNEQWPDYWVRLFRSYDYQVMDPFRRLLWENPSVGWWYAQNLLLFVGNESQSICLEQDLCGNRADDVLSLVHPRAYEHMAWKARVQKAAVDLASHVPPGSNVILADDWRWGQLYMPKHCIITLFDGDDIQGNERGGDLGAVNALADKIALSTRYLALGWPAFWMLDHYQAFAAIVKRQFNTLVDNERVKIYEVKGTGMTSV